ncbi:hypothetical protein G7Y89_g12296 [Cudoniella acicularis]|uniref:Uncharacterized protein n=1 Tax=Cudoniella acicularis TaxID=354080 RepID=A0A8H4RBP3_9HELO|nr:hypothetical protein G7Y89_g12296 [Cudoniella acicularis]
MFRSSAALFLTVLVSLTFKINAEAIATPPSPTHHNLAASEELRRRQSGLNGTDYCWGEGAENGICAIANNLLLLCSGFIDDSDETLYPKCFCGNGQISAQQACDWCLLDFNLPVGGGTYTVDTSSCASASATIAPIPSSILASISTWNVSFSGFLATAFSSGASGSNSASTGQVTQSATGSVNSAWTSTYTLATQRTTYVTLFEQSHKILDHMWCGLEDIMHDKAQASDWKIFRRLMQGKWSMPLLRTMLLLAAMVGCGLGLSAVTWVRKRLVPVLLFFGASQEDPVLSLLANHARKSENSMSSRIVYSVGRHLQGEEGEGFCRDLVLVDPETKLPIGILLDFLPYLRTDEKYVERYQSSPSGVHGVPGPQEQFSHLKFVSLHVWYHGPIRKGSEPTSLSAIFGGGHALFKELDNAFSNVRRLAIPKAGFPIAFTVPPTAQLQNIKSSVKATTEMHLTYIIDVCYLHLIDHDPATEKAKWNWSSSETKPFNNAISSCLRAFLTTNDVTALEIPLVQYLVWSQWRYLVGPTGQHNELFSTLIYQNLCDPPLSILLFY